MSTLRIYLTPKALEAIDEWRTQPDRICLEPEGVSCEVITDGKAMPLTLERAILVDVKRSTQQRVEVTPNNAEVKSWQNH